MPQSLSNLPIGAKVKFGKYSVNGELAQPITWLIAAKDHVGYPNNSVTLITEKVIDYRFYDNAEPDSTTDSQNMRGCSQYSTSNIDQWLNTDGEAGKWFVKQHDKDHAPDGDHAWVLNGSSIDSGTAYVNRPGFLNAFTKDEKDAILSTTIKSSTYRVSGGTSVFDSSNIDRRVFLPSIPEIISGFTFYDGTLWELFGTTSYAKTIVTEQAFQYSLNSNKSDLDRTDNVLYLTRTPSSYTSVNCVIAHDFRGNADCANGDKGIRPALNLSSTSPVSDTIDSDGAYTVVFNTAPPAPNTLSVPDIIHGGRNNTISWSAVTDPDGDSVTYELDCVYDGGTVFTTVYKGESLSYSHPVEYGKTSVQYRVRAIDSKGGVSGYTTAPSRSVTNNQPPTLAIVSNATTTDVSAKMSYSVFDTEGEKVTIDEYVDDEKIYTHTVQSSSPTTVNMVINALAWTRLSNGSHTIRIKATDTNGGTSEISSTFTKIIETISITTKPMKSSERPARITLTIARVIPEGANFKVFVCNNALDSAPDWEDATECVLKGDPYMFTNTTKTSSEWAVRVNIIVERNGAEGACYISSIGGAFD